MKRITLFWLALIGSVLMASSSFAASAKLRVAILVEGEDADLVRREIISSIPQGLAVQDSAELTSAIASQGVRGSLPGAVTNPKLRRVALDVVRKGLKQAGLAAAILVRSKKVGKAGPREIRVVLVVEAQTEPVIDESIAAPRSAKGIAKVQPLLSVALQDLANGSAPQKATESAAAAATVGKPPTTSKKEPRRERVEPVAGAETGVRAAKMGWEKANTEKEEEEWEPQPPGEGEDEEPFSSSDGDVVVKKRGRLNFNNAMVVAEAGVEVGTRQMKYNSVVVGPLREYLQAGIPSWAVGFQLYPAASKNIPIAKDIGIVARAADSLGFQSQTSDASQSVGGKWTRYAVGVRGRIAPRETAESPLFGVEATYGQWKFDFSGTDQLVLELPSVDYKFVRAGADARVPLGRASVFLAGGYMNIMSAGHFSDMFPHATIGGIDGKLGASYAFASWVEARASFAYARIFSNAKSQAQDTFVAGGALDEYFAGNLGVSAIF